MNKNPFTIEDADRYALWEMLVSRDIKAFAAQDWSRVENDFIADGFSAIDACLSANPDDWKLSFPNLDAYKNTWLQQAKEYTEKAWIESPEKALFEISSLSDIEINGDTALVHKIISGHLIRIGGEFKPVNWKTLYNCKKINGTWKISGFTGYLPNTATNKTPVSPAKQVPAGAVQHTTAGPYSPVLIINPGQLVVISGQAAIDMEGNVVGDTIETQTAYTLENCAKQLAYAGCTLQDVFKVNIYVKDLADWPKMNVVYKKYFHEPYPVRAAVQTGLLMTLLVEIEMWAVKS
jgi:enamine deaminase RidA (YjgF/YER057c/UK114 family)